MKKEEQKKVTIHIKGLGQIGGKYIQLFKAIKKQEVYNERVLKQKFPKNIFSNLKKRLYDLVLEGLGQFHQNSTIHHQILTSLQRFQLLYDKELYEQAYQELIYIKELSERNELLDYVQIVHERMLELQHRVYKFKHYTDKTLMVWLSSIRESKEQASNLMDFFLLQAQLYGCFYKEHFTQKEALQVQQIMKNPLFESEKSAKSIYAKILYFNIKMIYHNSINDNKKALNHSLKALSLYEDHFKNGHPKLKYIILICNVLNIAIVEKETLVVEALFNKIEQSKTQIIDKKIYQLMVLEFKMSWYREIGDIQRTEQLITENNEWLLQSNLDLSIIYFYFAIIAFLKEDYENAIHFLEYPLDHNKNTKFKDVQNFGRLFLIMIYFERGEFFLMEKTIRFLYRRLEQEANNYKLEWTILKYFKKLLNVKFDTHNATFRELKHELTLFEATAKHEQDLVLNLFHLMKWVEYQANKTSSSKGFYQTCFKKN